MHKTCPSCGRSESSELAFVKAFCIDCYSEREQLYELPKKLELKKCTRCGRYFFGGEWKHLPEEKLGEWVASKIKSPLAVSVASVTLKELRSGFLASIDLEFDADGAIVKKRASMHVGVLKGMCTNCHKKSGGYHEAIMQIRGGTPERRRKIAKEIIVACEKDSFVFDFVENKIGIDFCVGSRSIALRAAGALGRHFKHSNTLIGQREGKRMYRATICVRLD